MSDRVGSAWDILLRELSQAKGHAAPGLTYPAFGQYLRRHRSAIWPTFLDLFQACVPDAVELPVEHAPVLLDKIPYGTPYDTWNERARRLGNIEAFRVLQRLAQRASGVSESDREILRGWSGWGGVDLTKIPLDPDVFPPEYLEAFQEWRQLRSKDNTLPDGYVAKSKLLLPVVNQFFTPVEVCNFMWTLGLLAIQQSGVDVIPTTLLEPAAGSGRMVETAPAWLKEGNWTLVENDPIGASALSALYPAAERYAVNFEMVARAAVTKRRLWDFIIANPPYPSRFASDKLEDPDVSQYDTAHGYFSRRLSDLLKSGGVMVLLTPLGQIGSPTSRPKPEMRQLRADLLHTCDFVGAAALPADLFPGARLNLAVHVWRKKPHRRYGAPAQVAGMSIRDFLDGKYFAATGASNVLGAWTPSKRYSNSLEVVGDTPFQAAMAQQIILEAEPFSPEDLRDITAARGAYDSSVDQLMEVAGVEESLADKLRKAGRATQEGSTGSAVLQRAQNLSARIQSYIAAIRTDSGDLARLGRVELLADIEDWIAVAGSPWQDTYGVLKDVGCDWLRLAVDQATGGVIPEIAEGADTKERAGKTTRFQSAMDVIRWYSPRNGTCTTLDLLRHGFSEEQGLEAIAAAEDGAVLLGDEDGTYDFYQKTDFLAPGGSMWDLFDRVAQLRSSDSVPDILRAAYDRQYAWLYEALQPEPLDTISPEPRSSFVGEVIVNAFANWWIYDADLTGKLASRTDATAPFPLAPGIKLIKVSEVWRSYPAYLYPADVGDALFRLVPWTEDGLGAERAGEYQRLQYRRGWVSNPTAEDRARVMLAWKPLPELRELDSVTWANYWSLLGPRTDALKNVHTFRDYRGGHKQWREGADDRYCVLMGHLNQATRVPKLEEAGDRIINRIVLVEGRTNEEVLAEAFLSWLRTRPEYAEQVVTAYNRVFRGESRRTHPQDAMTIYRSAVAGSGISLKPYQWSTARRIAMTGSTMAALDVGFGKTYSALAGVAIARQNGTIRRAMVKAPNGVSSNWYEETQRLLPDYFITVIGSHPVPGPRGDMVWVDDTLQQRADKWAAAARGLYDLVIVPESKWYDDVAMLDDNIISLLQSTYLGRKAGAEAERERELIDQRIALVRKQMLTAPPGARATLEKKLVTLQEKLSALDTGSKDSPATAKTIYQLAARLDMIRTTKPFRPLRSYVKFSKGWSIEKLIEVAEKVGLMPPDPLPGSTRPQYQQLLLDFLDAEVPGQASGKIVVPHLVTWEALAVDCLVIDEAHRDKNISGPKGRGQIDFLGASDGGMQAIDTWLRCQWLLQTHQGRGVNLLTATPLKNSPMELYNLLSLMSLDVWSSRGIGDPDAFLNRYIRVDADVSVNARGVPEPRFVVGGFRRLQELRDIVRVYMERKTTEDLIAFYTSIGQLDAYRADFPTSSLIQHTVELDPVQLGVFQPIRDYLLQGVGLVTERGGKCRIMGKDEREKARAAAFKAKKDAGNLTELDVLLNEMETADPGLFALTIKDILEKVAYDPRLIQGSLQSNVDSLPRLRRRLDLLRERFKEEGRDIPTEVDTSKLADDESLQTVGMADLLAAKSLDPLTREWMTVLQAYGACKRAIQLYGMLEEIGGDFSELYTEAETSPPKMLAVADEIVATAIRDAKGNLTLPCGHLIFSDITTVHPWIIEALVRAGVPRNRIGVMDGSVPGPARQQMANDLNGTKTSPPSIDVLIGSNVMSEGLNLQRRTCTIHHLDLPWTPAELTQREGRAVRQNNKIGHVTVHTYMSPGTLDSFKYATIEGKRSWQNDFYNGSDSEMENPEKDAARVTREDLLANLVFYGDDPESVRSRECLLTHVRELRENLKRQQLMRRLRPMVAAFTAATATVRTVAKQGDPLLLRLAQEGLNLPRKNLEALADRLELPWVYELIRAGMAGPAGAVWLPGTTEGFVYSVGSLFVPVVAMIAAKETQPGVPEPKSKREAPPEGDDEAKPLRFHLHGVSGRVYYETPALAVASVKPEALEVLRILEVHADNSVTVQSMSSFLPFRVQLRLMTAQSFSGDLPWPMPESAWDSGQHVTRAIKALSTHRKHKQGLYSLMREVGAIPWDVVQDFEPEILSQLFAIPALAGNQPNPGPEFLSAFSFSDYGTSPRALLVLRGTDDEGNVTYGLITGQKNIYTALSTSTPTVAYANREWMHHMLLGHDFPGSNTINYQFVWPQEPGVIADFRAAFLDGRVYLLNVSPRSRMVTGGYNTPTQPLILQVPLGSEELATYFTSRSQDSINPLLSSWFEAALPPRSVAISAALVAQANRRIQLLAGETP